MPFPRFEDGDVEIRFTKEDESYVLHSYVLGLHSPWFKASLSERWNQEAASPGSRRVFELRFVEGGGTGILMRSTGVGETEMIQLVSTPATAALQDDEQEVQRLRSLDAHQAMLGALYHVPPNFRPFWHEDFTYIDTEASRTFVKSLTDTADYYDCAPVIDVHVDRYLRQWTSVVLKECFAEPYLMLNFGVQVKSAWIVKEACTYIICDYETRWAEARQKVHDELTSISGVLQEKRVQFIARLKDAELALFRIQSGDDTRDQLAVNIFRQWFGGRLDAGRGSVLGYNYAEVYRQICYSKPPFNLTTRNFHQHCGTWGKYLSDSTVQMIRARWDEVFAKAGEVVEDLCLDGTQFKGKMGLSTNLRFMTIEDDELPWKRKK